MHRKIVCVKSREPGLHKSILAFIVTRTPRRQGGPPEACNCSQKSSTVIVFISIRKGQFCNVAEIICCKVCCSQNHRLLLPVGEPIIKRTIAARKRSINGCRHHVNDSENLMPPSNSLYVNSLVRAPLDRGAAEFNLSAAVPSLASMSAHAWAWKLRRLS